MIRSEFICLELTKRELIALRLLVEYCQQELEKEKGRDERIGREKDKIVVYKPRYVLSEITDITISSVLFVIRNLENNLGEIGIKYGIRKVHFPSLPGCKRLTVGVLEFPADIVGQIEGLIKEKRLAIVEKRTARNRKTYRYIGGREAIVTSELEKRDLEILKMLVGYCKSQGMKADGNMISVVSPAKIVADLTKNYKVKIRQTSFSKFIRRIIEKLNKAGVEISYSSKMLRRDKYTSLAGLLKFPVNLIEQIEELEKTGVLEVKGE